MKRKVLLPIIIAMLTMFAGSTKTFATASCTIPCSGPWTNAQLSFTATYNGCLFKFYVKYQHRPCMGAEQVILTPDTPACCLGFLIEQLSGSCTLHCPDVPSLYRIVYNQLITSLGKPILHVSPSPCYYLGTIVVPPGAEACFGMTPGTRRYVTVPCDNNGCCYSKLEAVPNNGIMQTVIQSTGCNNSPTPPPSWNIQWSCDILGGGSMTFTVPFTPDSPLSCQTLCANGIFYFGGPPAKQGTTIRSQQEDGTITAFNIYPNPVADNCTVSFNSRNAAEGVHIELTDISGKVIRSFDLLTKKGEQKINLDTHDLAAGVYTIRLVYGEEVFVGKITK